MKRSDSFTISFLVLYYRTALRKILLFYYMQRISVRFYINSPIHISHCTTYFDVALFCHVVSPRRLYSTFLYTPHRPFSSRSLSSSKCLSLRRAILSIVIVTGVLPYLRHAIRPGHIPPHTYTRSQYTLIESYSHGVTSRPANDSVSASLFDAS